MCTYCSFNTLLTTKLKEAQVQDPIISVVHQARLQSCEIPCGTTWNRGILRRYKQLWKQLAVADGVLYRTYSLGPLEEVITVPILPPSLQQKALTLSHDIPTAGHLGIDKTLDRLRRNAYWVNMTRDVECYCRNCTTCQKSKLSLPPRAPLQNMPIGQPWQMVAVDILQVPLSTNNNRYLLVLQDYFTKWADAVPLPDQTANRIVAELVKFFCTYGPPLTIHSDQGRNFESTIFTEVLKAFGVSKSRTTPYHPQGDGMVERFNRTLLQLLRTYVSSNSDWEVYLLHVLYAYRTSCHTTTGAPPYLLLYGRNPPNFQRDKQLAYDPSTYSATVQARLAKLQDFVHTNISLAARNQKLHYDQHTSTPSFKLGDPVWLSVPTAGKLDPRWEGEWVVKSVKSPVSVEICDSKRTKVVHTNRLRHRYIPDLKDSTIHGAEDASTSTDTHVRGDWAPPGIEHIILPSLEEMLLNQFHATLRDIADHQIDMFHDMLVDKPLLGGASVILD